MKKLLCILISSLFILTCFASCHRISGYAETTDGNPAVTTSPPASAYAVPDDEQKITRTIVCGSDSNIKMEVTLYGYQSKSLNKSFYVKSNEYFIADVKIINDNATPGAIYQHLPTMCRGSNPPHNHEIRFYFANRYGNQLRSSCDSRGFAHPTAGEIWELESGESASYTLKLAAGEAVFGAAEEYDLPIDGLDGGIRLYDEGIYENGSCLFIGFIYFPFSYNHHGSETKNDAYVAAEISFEVIYVAENQTTPAPISQSNILP